MEVKKALTFRASSIGDCLMGKYLLENVHEEFPDARLGIVVASRASMLRDLFAAYPWLEIVEVNRRSPASVLRLLWQWRGSNLVVTQYAGKPGGRFSLASKIVARMLAKRGGLIGFSDSSRWNRALYDHLVPLHLEEAVAERDRAALRAAGISVLLPFPTLRFVEDHSVLDRFNLTRGGFIIVHLFSGSAARGLHPDKKRELIGALAKECADARLVISGGLSDREEAMKTAEGIPAAVIAGEATLQEMMNLIQKSRGVVSVDTGMAHITAQLGKPLIVLHTCLGANWWNAEQYGKDVPITRSSREELCAEGHTYKDFPDCINQISINTVARAAAQL